jgi:hypothetical protein
MRILFVGNSYTEAWQLTGLIRELLAARGTLVEVARYTLGGASLRDHWNHNAGLAEPDPTAAARRGGLDVLLTKQGPWDFVVLQGQSQEALKEQPCEFDQYAALLAEKVHRAQPRARLVFYLTWARQHIPTQQEEITHTYLNAARRHKARVAPAGEAWKDAVAARPALVLHEPDQSHPAVNGCYLTACVFCATLTGTSPVGLPGRIESLREGGKIIYDLADADARFFQETAWKACRRVHAELAPPQTM